MQSELLGSHILICDDIDSHAKEYEALLKPNRVVLYLREEFKIEDARAVGEEAYISESAPKYLILASSSFNHFAQNALLKLLEEPPRNIIFILMTTSKSNLLPTVRSRLQTKRIVAQKEHVILDISLKRLSNGAIFDFLKKAALLSKGEAKMLVDALYYRAVVVDGLTLGIKQLDNFERAYKLLELNTRPLHVFALLLMGFKEEV